MNPNKNSPTYIFTVCTLTYIVYFSYMNVSAYVLHCIDASKSKIISQIHTLAEVQSITYNESHAIINYKTGAVNESRIRSLLASENGV